MFREGKFFCGGKGRLHLEKENTFSVEEKKNRAGKRMIICKRPAPSDGHLQEAVSLFVIVVCLTLLFVRHCCLFVVVVCLSLLFV